MVHGYSCDLAVVVLQEAAQPLLAAHPAAAVAGGSVGAGKQEHVPFALMIPLGVKMFYVFCQHSPQRCLPEEHQLGEAFLLGQTGPIGKNTTLSSHCPVALDDVWAERSEPAPRSLSSFPVVRAGEDDVLPA